VRGLARWIADSLAFYLALYLVDSLISPRFHVAAVWIAVVLAVFLGLMNSLVRPLYRVKSKPAMAIGEAVTTLFLNALVLQIAIWAGAPLSATSLVWIVAMAVFLTLLGGLINWLIGFKKKEKPGAIVRERRPARVSADNEAKKSRRRT
jgi:putative membrane protein